MMSDDFIFNNFNVRLTNKKLNDIHGISFNIDMRDQDL